MYLAQPRSPARLQFTDAGRDHGGGPGADCGPSMLNPGSLMLSGCVHRGAVSGWPKPKRAEAAEGPPMAAHTMTTPNGAWKPTKERDMIGVDGGCCCNRDEQRDTHAAHDVPVQVPPAGQASDPMAAGREGPGNQRQTMSSPPDTHRRTKVMSRLTVNIFPGRTRRPHRARCSTWDRGRDGAMMVAISLSLLDDLCRRRVRPPVVLTTDEIVIDSSPRSLRRSGRCSGRGASVGRRCR